MLESCLLSFIFSFCSLSLQGFLPEIQHFSPPVLLVRIMLGVLLFCSSLCCYFLLYCRVFSAACCGMLLKRAADVEEEELEEKAADSVLLKLESCCWYVHLPIRL